jgi:hypothetical protein
MDELLGLADRGPRPCMAHKADALAQTPSRVAWRIDQCDSMQPMLRA